MKTFQITEFHVSLIRLSWRGFKIHALNRLKVGF